MASRIIQILFLLPLITVAQPTITTDTKDYQTARQRLYVGTDTSKYVSTISQVINASSTHRQMPTAKGVYDALSAFISTVSTDATLSGNGSAGSPLKIAQQSATTGRVLRWNGSTWVPAQVDASGLVNTGASAGSYTAANVTIGPDGRIYTISNGAAGGDLTGPLTNLQLIAGAVGTADISNNAIIADLIGTGQVTGIKLAQDGATTGQVWKWNGTTWAPSDDMAVVFPILAPNGSSTGPSYSFSNYPKMGVYASVSFSQPRFNIVGGSATGTARGGSLYGVAGSSETGGPGVINYTAGSATGATGGAVTFTSGTSTSTNPAHNGGDVVFLSGSSAAGRSGNIVFQLGGSGSATSRGFVTFSTPYTPTSSADSNGSAGSFSWDENDIFLKTSTGWKKSHLVDLAVGTGSGTVTSVSVATANGFSGTVATATTTPAITISTTVTGLLKGNGTSISAATAGTDYVTPTMTADQTITTGNNALVIDASTATSTISAPLVIRGKADGSSATQPITFQNALGVPQSFFNISSTATYLAVATGKKLVFGAGTAGWELKENGTAQFPGVPINPSASGLSGGFWYNSSAARFAYSDGSNIHYIAKLSDVAGNNATYVSSQTLAASVSSVEADANAGPITITLDGTMTPDFTTIIRATRNNTNAVTLSAGSGYVFKVDGNASVTQTSYTLTAGEIVTVRRDGTKIFVNK